jgi:serine protease Do
MDRNAVIALVVVALACGSAPSAGQERAAARETSLQALSGSFQALSERMSQAVVQVLTSGYGPIQGLGPGGVAAQRGAGSGVILDPEGYIVTNAHVVESAQRVQVLLPLGPVERRHWQSLVKPRGKIADARIVGTDVETDLAILEIDVKGLPALELGDSDRLRQGQIVLAFGSPLGLENSVSMGVVSAVARQLKRTCCRSSGSSRSTSTSACSGRSPRCASRPEWSWPRAW